MNYKQLERINRKLKDCDMWNINLLIDEADLCCGTSSNNCKHETIGKNKCERNMAMLCKKASYVLCITGTPSALFWNKTTRVDKNIMIKLGISKVHKMKRRDKYHGIMNERIIINSDLTTWWASGQYKILKDYGMNIKNVITKITQRDHTNSYSSLLISEELNTETQLKLSNMILSNHNDVFLIIFNGKYTRLYSPNIYINKLVKCSRKYSRRNIASVMNLKNNIHIKNVKKHNEIYDYFEIKK